MAVHLSADCRDRNRTRSQESGCLTVVWQRGASLAGWPHQTRPPWVAAEKTDTIARPMSAPEKLRGSSPADGRGGDFAKTGSGGGDGNA